MPTIREEEDEVAEMAETRQINPKDIALFAQDKLG